MRLQEMKVTEGFVLTPLQQTAVGAESAKWMDKDIRVIRQEVLSTGGLYDTYKALIKTVQEEVQRGFEGVSLDEQKTHAENLQKLSCMKQVFRQLDIREYSGGWFSKIGTYLSILFTEGYTALRACKVVQNTTPVQEAEIQERICATAQAVIKRAGYEPRLVEGRKYVFSYQPDERAAPKEVAPDSPDLVVLLQGAIEQQKRSGRVDPQQVQAALRKKSEGSDTDTSGLTTLCQTLNGWAAPWHVGPQGIPPKAYVFHVDAKIGTGEALGHGLMALGRWVFGRQQVAQRVPEPRVSIIEWNAEQSRFAVKTEKIQVLPDGRIQMGEGPSKREFATLEEAEASLKGGGAEPYEHFSPITTRMQEAHQRFESTRPMTKSQLPSSLALPEVSLARTKEMQDPIVQNSWKWGRKEISGRNAKKQECIFRYDTEQGNFQEERVQITREGKYVLHTQPSSMTFNSLEDLQAHLLRRGVLISEVEYTRQVFALAQEAANLVIRGTGGEGDKPRGADSQCMNAQIRGIADKATRGGNSIGGLYRRTDEAQITYDWVFKKPGEAEVQGYRIQCVPDKKDGHLRPQIMLIPLTISEGSIQPDTTNVTTYTNAQSLEKKLGEIKEGLSVEDNAYLDFSGSLYTNGTVE